MVRVIVGFVSEKIRQYLKGKLIMPVNTDDKSLRKILEILGVGK